MGGTVSEIGGGKFANGAVTASMVHLFNAEGNHRTPNEGEIRNFEMEGKILYNGKTDAEFANGNALTAAIGSGLAVVGDSGGLPISAFGRGNDSAQLLAGGAASLTSDALKMGVSSASGTPSSYTAAEVFFGIAKGNSSLRNVLKITNSMEVQVRFDASWQVYTKRHFWFDGWANRSGSVTIDIQSHRAPPSRMDVSRARGSAINHFLMP